MLHRLVLVSMFASIAMLSPVTADPRRGEQNEAREDMKAGKIKRLPEIEAIIVPRMRGMQYLGPEYDPVAQVYRLKFINRDRVIFVDVDARTGNVIRQR
ncbi:PepSY domain-containing protein [Sphingorhabdus sp.]|uniref:PepSY domain-containing protein n=1 Tax=Sphingorhabdus sp. TaxID=1902408 RepID=UPI0025EF70CC|nr:PepSY domain-containing protein [Sphingorhabdus sp.]